VVIRLTAQCFTRTEVSGSRLRCGAGAKLKQVALAACEHGLSGLEFMEGIPGTLGGALRLNAGAMHGQTFDVVESVDFLDERGEVSGLPAADFKAEYRDCAFFRSHIALAAVLRGEPAPPETIRQRMEDYRQRRLATQPCQASAGCVFKNPTGVPAGRLLEELGLKGTRAGPAVVSAAHANFIVNEGGASAAEILELIEMLKQRVKQQRGIELETEIEVVGE
jgi:UDP-N-acetylenolpyruvoylglucosamine reductase